jgi:hypothetical protein
MKPSNLKSKAKANESPTMFNARIATKRGIPKPNAGQKEVAMKASSKQTGKRKSVPSRTMPRQTALKRPVITMPIPLTSKLGQP